MCGNLSGGLGQGGGGGGGWGSRARAPEWVTLGRPPNEELIEMIELDTPPSWGRGVVGYSITFIGGYPEAEAFVVIQLFPMVPSSECSARS